MHKQEQDACTPSLENSALAYSSAFRVLRRMGLKILRNPKMLDRSIHLMIQDVEFWQGGSPDFSSGANCHDSSNKRSAKKPQIERAV